MMKTVDENDVREYVKEKYLTIKDWVVDNQQLIITVAPIVITGAFKITKLLVTRSNIKKAEALKKLYVYDRSLGHYWELKRKLSNNEWVKIESRSRSGEPLAYILDSLKVLK